MLETTPCHKEVRYVPAHSKPGTWAVLLGGDYMGDYATAEDAVAAAAGLPHEWKPSMLQLTLGTLAVAMARNGGAA